MNKKYSDLSEGEKLSLLDADLVRAVTLEAVHRGIAPPTRLDTAISLTGAKGFSMPAEADVVYEICAKTKNYGGVDRTGIAFKSPEKAMQALEGAFAVVTDGFEATEKQRIINPYESFEVRTTHCVYTPNKGYWTKLIELQEDCSKFDEVVEECRQDLEKVRQTVYDREVNQARRKQYVELAGGDVSIARAFWQKTQSTPFPEEVSS